MIVSKGVWTYRPSKNGTDFYIEAAHERDGEPWIVAHVQGRGKEVNEANTKHICDLHNGATAVPDTNIGSDEL